MFVGYFLSLFQKPFNSATSKRNGFKLILVTRINNSLQFQQKFEVSSESRARDACFCSITAYATCCSHKKFNRRDRQLCIQINEQQYAYSKSGHLQFSHLTKSHDNMLWALALSVYAAREPSRKEPTFTFY